MKIQRQNETFTWRFALRWRERSPQELARYRQDLEDFVKTAHDAGVDTRSLFGDRGPGGGYAYDPVRSKQHDFIKNFMYYTGGPENKAPHGRSIADSPRERQALLLAGLPGSGKGFNLKHKQVAGALNPSYISNPDPLKFLMAHMGMGASQEQILEAIKSRESREKLAEKGYDPDWVDRRFQNMPRYSPMDLSPLMHEEASTLNKNILKKALEEGRNVTLDGTMAAPAHKNLALLREHDYGDNLSGILVNASRGPAEAQALDRYASGDDRFKAGEPEQDWQGLGLGDTWTPETGFAVPLNRSPGGRFVGNYVAPPAPTDGSKSISEQNFKSIQDQLTRGAVSINGDKKHDRSLMARGIVSPIELEYGHGELFDKMLRSGAIVLPGERKAFRMAGAEQGADDSEFRREYDGSAADILLRYKRGEFDYSTLVRLLVDRTRFLKAKEESTPAAPKAPSPYGWWHEILESSEQFNHDDIFGEVAHACWEGVITEEQKAEIESLISDVYWSDRV
jgi:uncharacterized protein YneF (UPF0154 family)